MVQRNRTLAVVRLRPGFGGTAFARFATMKLSLVRAAEACAASEGWWAHKDRTLDLSRVKDPLH